MHFDDHKSIKKGVEKSKICQISDFYCSHFQILNTIAWLHDAGMKVVHQQSRQTQPFHISPFHVSAVSSSRFFQPFPSAVSSPNAEGPARQQIPGHPVVREAACRCVVSQRASHSVCHVSPSRFTQPFRPTVSNKKNPNGTSALVKFFRGCTATVQQPTLEHPSDRHRG